MDRKNEFTPADEIGFRQNRSTDYSRNQVDEPLSSIKARAFLKPSDARRGKIILNNFDYPIFFEINGVKIMINKPLKEAQLVGPFIEIDNGGIIRFRREGKTWVAEGF